MLAVQAIKFIWAINSEGECLLDVEKVIGSNPILPTNPNLKRTTFECRVLGFFFTIFTNGGLCRESHLT